MTRLLTSISLRSTLDTMAALDFLNSLAKNKQNKTKKKKKQEPFWGRLFLLHQKEKPFYLHDVVWYQENVYNVFLFICYDTQG